MKELTLLQLSNTSFKSLYAKLIRKVELDRREYTKLLAIAVLLLNNSARPARQLGYRIALFYGNISGDYKPLYEISVNIGLIPVAAAIDEILDHYEILGHDESATRETFVKTLTSSYVDTFRRGSIVQTEQQAILEEFFQTERSRSTAIIAPTSYGKSELIIDFIRKHPGEYTLILVPSKALLAQTKKRLIDAKISHLGKVITHPEMYVAGSPNRTFVLTQERLARALSESPELSFHTVFVDEAHNILDGDRRSELLATVISMLASRSKCTRFKFLTPFLCDELNLKVRHLDQPIAGFKIDEYVKSERFHLCDFRPNKGDGALRFYDQFLNEWITLDNSYKSWIELILGESLNKNIIYGNRPKKIEQFAELLASKLPKVDCPLISAACDELEATFDKNYRLVKCLKYGVMYHHGSIPETVRCYLESLFSKSKQMRYLVCNTTLLEGVNLPIERLFIFDPRMGISNLTPSKFKNLVGRVNRFSDTFSARDRTSLQKLEPSIYLLGIDGFTNKSAKLIDFFKNTVKATRQDRDSVNNVLLANSNVSSDKAKLRLTEATDRLENLQPGSVPGGASRVVSTKVGKLLIANSVDEIDVFESEGKVASDIQKFKDRHGPIDSPRLVMEAIKTCFIDNFDESREYSDLKRLNQTAALNFYAMLLDWKLQKYSIKQSIKLTISYWNRRVEEGKGDLVFVGHWGDSKYGKSPREHWVDIGSKSEVEKINLAIVRLKEEDDFLDYRVFRFIEILNSVGAIDPNFYKLLKYGTTDETRIKLIREGFSRSLTELILVKYPSMLITSTVGDIQVDPRLTSNMMKEGESDLLVFEVQMNLGTP